MERRSESQGITPEVAIQDIRKVLEHWSSMGEGTEIDRAAQLVLQSLQVFRRRVDKPKLIRFLYLDNDQANGLLPDAVLKTAQGLADGTITPDEAGQSLDQIIPQYGEAFVELGVKPEKISVLFHTEQK